MHLLCHSFSRKAVFGATCPLVLLECHRGGSWILHRLVPHGPGKPVLTVSPVSSEFLKTRALWY